MEINFKNIYNTKEEQKVLIIFNISKSHYVGIPIYKQQNKNSIHIPSLDFYYNPAEMKDFKYTDFKNILYIGGKIARVKEKEFCNITHSVKLFIINTITSKMHDNTLDSFLYIKWINDMLIMNNSNYISIEYDKIRPRAIYWVNFGFGVGSELRKLRPAILWRYTGKKEICTFIPLTSKHFNDKYDFHYDLTCIENSTAKIESLENLSNKRIYATYMRNGKPVYINNIDFNRISIELQKFYTYS